MLEFRQCICYTKGCEENNRMYKEKRIQIRRESNGLQY